LGRLRLTFRFPSGVAAWPTRPPVAVALVLYKTFVGMAFSSSAGCRSLLRQKWAHPGQLIRRKYLELHFHLWKNIQSG
jgi:hypothetical protein